MLPFHLACGERPFEDQVEPRSALGIKTNFWLAENNISIDFCRSNQPSKPQDNERNISFSAKYLHSTREELQIGEDLTSSRKMSEPLVYDNFRLNDYLLDELTGTLDKMADEGHQDLLVKGPIWANFSGKVDQKKKIAVETALGERVLQDNMDEPFTPNHRSSLYLEMPPKNHLNEQGDQTICNGSDFHNQKLHQNQFALAESSYLAAMDAIGRRAPLSFLSSASYIQIEPVQNIQQSSDEIRHTPTALRSAVMYDSSQCFRVPDEPFLSSPTLLSPSQSEAAALACDRNSLLFSSLMVNGAHHQINPLCLPQTGQDSSDNFQPACNFMLTSSSKLRDFVSSLNATSHDQPDPQSWTPSHPGSYSIGCYPKNIEANQPRQSLLGELSSPISDRYVNPLPFEIPVTPQNSFSSSPSAANSIRCKKRSTLSSKKSMRSTFEEPSFFKISSITKKARGRRPLASPCLGLAPNHNNEICEADTKPVPGGRVFDPNLTPNCHPDLLKLCDVTKTGKFKKIFICQVDGCGKCFKRGEHLKRHVQTIHCNDKPYQCPWPECEKLFNRHDNLTQHLKTHSRGIGLNHG